MPASAIGQPTGIAVREQFSNPAQQKRAAELGMWAWLLTELLLFGGLFLIALVLHHTHPGSVRATSSARSLNACRATSDSSRARLL